MSAEYREVQVTRSLADEKPCNCCFYFVLTLSIKLKIKSSSLTLVFTVHCQCGWNETLRWPTPSYRRHGNPSPSTWVGPCCHYPAPWQCSADYNWPPSDSTAFWWPSFPLQLVMIQLHPFWHGDCPLTVRYIQCQSINPFNSDSKEQTDL